MQKFFSATLFKVVTVHLLISLSLAAVAAVLVLGIWYPSPYSDLSGGRNLFLLLVGVDVVCGPLLTMVVFSSAKPRAELWRDLGLVVLIQLAALFYGMRMVWEARPLLVVMEVDRFKVVIAADLDVAAVSALPSSLKPLTWGGPRVVATRRSTSL